MPSGTRFPHPVYASTILGPQFHASQRWLFEPMLESSEAHLLMLVEQGLMPPEQGHRVWHALTELSRQGAESFEYAPDVEDLFFQMEARILELAGEVAGGNLHLARSRNDLDAAMARLTVRRLLLETHAALEALRVTLLRLIDEHVRTLMPGHTHTQPAQPTTLAHYLAATAQALERDAARLQAAFGRTNLGPLGAAALTTTGFPIDRALTARLLGFDRVLTNSIDAIPSSTRPPWVIRSTSRTSSTNRSSVLLLTASRCCACWSRRLPPASSTYSAWRRGPAKALPRPPSWPTRSCAAPDSRSARRTVWRRRLSDCPRPTLRG